MQLIDLLPTFMAAAGGTVEPLMAHRRYELPASMDRQGGGPGADTSSGNGKAKAPTSLPLCAVDSSS